MYFIKYDNNDPLVLPLPFIGFKFAHTRLIDWVRPLLRGLYLCGEALSHRWLCLRVISVVTSPVLAAPPPAGRVSRSYLFLLS